MKQGISGKTRLVAILGWPLSYTLSPRMQNAALQGLGIDAAYLALPAPDPKAFNRLVRGLQQSPHFVGANVTNPHKVAALRLVDRLSPAAKAIGAVNTLVRRRGVWEGHNTDAEGFLAALRRRGLRLAGKRVLVLGAGGAAQAVVWACAQGKAGSVMVLSRRRAPGLACAALAGRRGAWGSLNPTELSRRSAMQDLVVNTLPGPELGKTYGEALSRGQGLAMDISYVPVETAFCKAAKKRGWRSENGLNMLIEQGLLSFELWFGRRPPRARMAGALRKV